LLYPIIGSNIVVECLNALCLAVVIVGMINHMAIPERIVGKDEASWAEDRQHHLITVAVGTLVAIDEGHIELNAELWRFDEGIANDELYLVGHWGTLDPRPCEVLHLVVDLEGVKSSALVKTLCHGDGTIATERADLEDRCGTYHPDEHLQQATLQVSAGHTTMDGVDVRGTPETVEVVGFRLRVTQDIIFYF